MLDFSKTRFVIFLFFAFYTFSSFTLLDFWIDKPPQKLPNVTVDQYGNAVAAYKIEIPTALKEIAPNLQLTYNSELPSGLLGRGWEINIQHSIERDIRGSYDHGLDSYTSTMGGELVPTSEDGVFRTKPESLFVFKKINGTTWQAKDKNGLIYTFGGGSQLNRDSSIYNSEIIQKWRLSSVKDKFGVGYDVEYGTPIDINGKFPITIKYQNREISFEYIGNNENALKFSNFIRSQENAILSGISIKVDNSIVRKYKFNYTTNDLGEKSLSKISREETNNFGEGKFEDIELSYGSKTPSVYGSKVEKRIPNLFAMSRVPLQDKFECNLGTLNCLTYTTMVCNMPNPAALLSCQATKASYGALCQQFQNTWFIPCMTGTKSPNNLLTFGDTDGDGKLEGVRLVGSDDDNTLRIVSIKNPTTSMDEVTISPNFSGINYNSFSTMSWGDVDGDGNLDLAFSNGQNIHVSFSRNGNFTDPISMPSVPLVTPEIDFLFSPPDLSWKGGLVDIDGDGRSDYVKKINETTISVSLSQGVTFGPERHIDVGPIFYDESMGQFMDFDSDGKPEFVHVLNGEVIVRKIFLNSSSSIEYRLGGIYTGNGNRKEEGLNRWFADINNDGRPDFCVLMPNGLFYTYINQGRSFAEGVNQGYLPGMAYQSEVVGDEIIKTKTFADVNQDGKTDLLAFDGSSVFVSYGNGASFVGGGALTNADSFFGAMDLNQDGRVELIHLRADKNAFLLNVPYLNFYPNIQDYVDGTRKSQNFFAKHQRGFDAFVSKYFPSKPKMSAGFLLSILSLLALYDTPEGGNLSITPVVPNNSHSNLVRLSDGMWFDIEITYKKTNEFPNAIAFNSGSYPNIAPPISKHQVSEITSRSSSNTLTEKYDYSNFRIHLGDLFSRAYYGFEKITETNLLHNTKKETVYYQTQPNLTGLEKSITNFYSDGSLSSNVAFTYQVKQPFLSALVVRNSQISNSFVDSYLFKKEEMQIVFDNYGNALSNKAYLNGVLLKTEDSTFDNNISFDNYYIGRPNRIKKYIKSELISDEELLYTNQGLVAEIISFPGSSDQAKLQMSYDDFGRVQSKNIPGMGEVVTEYDSFSGINIIGETNSLGHKTVKRYDISTDALIEEVSENGASLRKDYDPFLNEKSEILPGDTEPNVKQAFKFDRDFQKLRITKQNRNSEGGYSVVTEVLNNEGKLESRITQLNDSASLSERREYDTFGRLTKKYSPIVEGVMDEEWEEYDYDNYDRIIGARNSKGERMSINYSPNQLTTTSTMFGANGEIIQAVEVEKNSIGQEIRRTVNGLTHLTSYTERGEVATITDPSGNQFKSEYDNRGRKILQSDPTSGVVRLSYDSLGRLSRIIKADGSKTDFTFDNLSRIKTQNTIEKNITFTYDVGGATSDTYPVGRLTQVNEGALVVNIDYDQRGNIIRQKKSLDDLHLFVESAYDTNNNPVYTRYPEGTTLRYSYGSGGHLNKITLDSADGNSTNQLLVKYEGPFIDGDKLFIRKTAGNGVESQIEIDKKHKRLVGLRTKLSNGYFEQNLKYEYDYSGNISKIQDLNRDDRTQTYEYDGHNRLLKAAGKYGEEVYEYSNDGNLLRRGDVRFKYENSNRPHLVTEASSPQIGTFHYSYDENGNMINRNGDIHVYNTNNQLTQIRTSGGTNIRYLYDQSGNRIKKDIGNGKHLSYSLFGDSFDVTREEGVPESVTIYVKGLRGEPLAQIAIPDVKFLRDENFTSLAGWDKLISENLSVIDCSRTRLECSQYRKNRIDSMIFEPIRKKLTKENIKLGSYSFQIAFLGFLFNFVRRQNSKYSNLIPTLMRYANALLLFSFLFSVGNCGFLGVGSNGAEQPLLIFPTQVSESAPSVNDSGNDYIPGSGATVSPISSSSISGIAFQHADHLGSVSFLSDSQGNPLSGGDWTGRSRIAYRPYGLIHRTDSGGPDISKIKYAGQLEDKESGLYYMKARYYDPFVGRFLTGDPKIYPKQVNGLNRYMYTNGNPIKYNDPTGFGKQTPYLGAAIVYMLSAGMNERDRLLLTASAFAEFRGNERGKQSWLEKTSGKNASHLGKPHVSKALQYALAAYYLMPADNDFDRVRNLFMGFTMGKRAGGSYNSIEGKKDDRVHIGKSWKMAFAAYMLTKEKDHSFTLMAMAAGYVQGNKQDINQRPMQDVKETLISWQKVFTFKFVLAIVAAIAAIVLLFFIGPVYYFVLGIITTGMGVVSALANADNSADEDSSAHHDDPK